jgi:hypothetical protein
MIKPLTFNERLRRIFLLVLAMCACGAWRTSPDKFVLNFYVTVVPQVVSPEGFVEGSNKELVDSVKDLQKALDGKDLRPEKGWPGSHTHFTAVTDATKGDIVLTVAARGVSSESLGQRTTMQFYGGVALADTMPTVGVTRWVSMVLSVGTYRKEFVSWSTNRSRYSAGAWTDDAYALAKLAAAWVMANEAQIRERQKARSK